MNTMLQPTKKLRSRNIQTSTCLIPDNEREKNAKRYCKIRTSFSTKSYIRPMFTESVITR